MTDYMMGPKTYATNLHCVTDLLEMLTISVARHGGELWITPEMVQDFKDSYLFLESGYDNPCVRLSLKKRRVQP